MDAPQTATDSTLVLTTTLVAVSNEDEEDTSCPVCYESLPPSVSTVSCSVCKHVVCDECDTMLKHAGHWQCPVCRAPRPREPLNICMTIHAFHCFDPACVSPQCTEAKLLLVRMEAHVRNSQHCTDDCKVCKLWRVLYGPLTPRVPPAAVPVPMLPSRSQVRELPPTQVKSMLLARVRQCRDRRCQTCSKMREHIHKRRLPLATRTATS